ncbi:hypothetical protein ACQ4M4_17600 [Leptolyngbya sp. AN02str]|uniref:hypothetical protein n=1 Tax=Leptolyngbya sp. AN02str TaxID=3423363 RepID=UPI003D31834F
MLSQIYYLLRTRQDGQYLVARPRVGDRPPSPQEAPPPGFVLLFHDHAEALSYLNTHGADVADRFAVESVTSNQVGQLLKRWGFDGVGIVQDPLIPRVQFLQGMGV